MLDSLFLSNPDNEFHVHFLHPPSFHPVDRASLERFVVEHGGRISFWPIADDDVAGLPHDDHHPEGDVVPDLPARPAPRRRSGALPRCRHPFVVDDVTPLFDQPARRCLTSRPSPTCSSLEFANRVQTLGLPASQTYFNSGVLVLDLAAIRADHCTDRIVEYARSESLLWPDQDALNVVLGSRCILLHPRWNCMNSLYVFPEGSDAFATGQVDEACARPAIVHFEGPQFMKPWHYLSKHPYRSTYLAIVPPTPWPDVHIQGRTLRNRVLPTASDCHQVAGARPLLSGSPRHRTTRRPGIEPIVALSGRLRPSR